VTSNDICPRKLDYNPLRNVNLHLLAAHDDDPFVPSTLYVADQWVYFKLYTEKAGAQGLRLSQMQLLNFSFGSNVIYNMGTWLGGLVPGKNYFACDNLVMPTISNSECYTTVDGFHFPIVWLGFKLEDTIFGLTRLLTPASFPCLAYVKFTYTYIDTTGKAQLQSEVSAFGTATTALNFAYHPVTFSPATATAAPASTSTGVIVGVVIGVIALIALAVAAVFIRRRRLAANSKPVKLNEEPQTKA
jgi:hypothetical protein